MPIKKRDTSWEVTVNYTRHGKYLKKRKSGFRTKGDATRYEAKLINELKSLNAPDNEKHTMQFVDYYDEWFAVYSKTGIRERTIKTHLRARELVHQYLSGYTLGEVSRTVLQTMVNELSQSLKPSTVNLYFSKICIPLRDAFRDGYIVRDPTYGIKIPKDTDTEEERIRYLNMDDMNTLLNFIEGNKLTAPRFAIYIALKSGLRIGEIGGLTLKDIDTKNKTLTVNKQRTADRPFRIVPTKTKKSNRTIAMPDSFFIQLKRYLKDNPHPDERFLGNNLKYETCNYQLKTTLPKLDIDTSISMHDLRHTHASYLFNKGASLQYVSERLGHANTRQTEQTYIHLFKETREAEARRAMEFL